jgi:AMP nucleosidase
MLVAYNLLTPDPIAVEEFTDAFAAAGRLEEICKGNTAFLRRDFGAYLNGSLPQTRVQTAYPFVRVTAATHARLDSSLF